MANDYVLGIDIGGTNTKFGLVSESGEVPFCGRLKTQQFPQLEDCAAEILKKVEDWRHQSDFTLRGVGVGAPDSNYHTGEIIRPHNLPYGTVNAADTFTELFKVPTFLTNDANCMALAEKKFGAAKDFNNFIEITLGTGLGSGIITSGRLLVGNNGMAGEAGHIRVSDEQRECPCGGMGHLEAFVSAGGILQTAHELGLTANGVEELSQLARSGNRQAQQVFEKTSEYLGKGLAILVTLFCPEAIVIAGGISESLPMMEESLNAHLNKNVFRLFTDQTKILPSALEPSRGGIRGASVLVFEDWVEEYS